jgi:hypothetical protein
MPDNSFDRSLKAAERIWGFISLSLIQVEREGVRQGCLWRFATLITESHNVDRKYIDL